VAKYCNVPNGATGMPLSALSFLTPANDPMTMPLTAQMTLPQFN